MEQSESGTDIFTLRLHELHWT